MQLQFHLIVFLGRLFVDSTEVYCFLLVIHVKSNIVDRLPSPSNGSVELQGDTGGVHEFVEGDVMSCELDSII